MSNRYSESIDLSKSLNCSTLYDTYHGLQCTGTKKGEFIMLNQKELMAKALEMVKEGKTFEEALQFVLNETTKGTVKREGSRAEWMAQLDDIQELRRAVKSSNGMKSKMKNNPEAVERYKEEIRVGQQRIRDLMDKINRADNPYEEAKKYNVEDADLLNIWLERTKTKIDELFKATKEAKKLSNDDARRIRFMMDRETPPAIERELKAIDERLFNEYQNRLSRGDQWIETINKTYRFCGIED
jgi:uncharacterized coiled-coil DUF342 family protein